MSRGNSAKMVEKNVKSGKLSTIGKIKKAIHGQRSIGESFDVIVEKNSAKWKGTQADSKNERVFPPIQNIGHLAIKEDELKKIREECQIENEESEVLPLKTITVQKTFRHGPVKKVAVLRPAGNDAEIMPLVINYAGPRFDGGRFIQHSILGSLEDFTAEAQSRGEYQYLYSNNKLDQGHRQGQKREYCNELLRWKKQNADWQNTINYLAAKVGRPQEDLVMKTVNSYPAMVEERLTVSMALDATSSGYGSQRKQSRFFKLNDHIGNELDGIYTTLMKSDAGDMNLPEMKGIPNCVQQEKGNDAWNIDRTYPVYHTPYLKSQKEKVKDIIQIFRPFDPLFEEIQVIGREIKKNTEEIPSSPTDSSQGKITLHSHLCDDIDQNSSCKNKVPLNFTQLPAAKNEMNGPAMNINGTLVTYEGQGHLRKGQVGVKLSVLFDGFQEDKLIQHFEIENVGTASIRYEWKKKMAPNRFDIAKHRVQRFYFLHEGGILAPGKKLVLPIVFKSQEAGIFYETWKFETIPVLCGGADILVNFKGVVSPVETYTDEFTNIEEKLFHRKGVTIVNEVVERLINSLVIPDRTWPILPDTSEAEEFEKENRGVYFHAFTINRMTILYRLLQDVFPETASPDLQFSLKNLRKAIISMTDLEEEDVENKDLSHVVLEPDEDWSYTKRRLLWRYLRYVDTLVFPCPRPVLDDHTRTYYQGYRLMQMAVDQFVNSANIIAEQLELPIKVEEDEGEEEISKTEKKKPKRGTTPVAAKAKKSSGNKESDKNRSFSPNEKSLSMTPSRRGKKSITPSNMMVDSSTSVKQDYEGKFCLVLKNKMSDQQINTFHEKLYLKAYNILYTTSLKLANLADCGELID